MSQLRRCTHLVSTWTDGGEEILVCESSAYIKLQAQDNNSGFKGPRAQLAACDFELNFTYLAGYEGSVNDSTVFKSAISTTLGNNMPAFCWNSGELHAPFLSKALRISKRVSKTSMHAFHFTLFLYTTVYLRSELMLTIPQVKPMSRVEQTLHTKNHLPRRQEKDPDHDYESVEQREVVRQTPSSTGISGKLEQYVRQWYICTFSNANIDQPIQMAFPGMSSNNQTYRKAVVRVRQLYKDFKSRTFADADRWFGVWTSFKGHSKYVGITDMLPLLLTWIIRVHKTR